MQHTSDNLPVDVPAEGGMHRALQNRHIQMIALGSSIGTGLFLASGSSVQSAGPAVLLAFIVAGAVIFLVMRFLGEMAVDRPVSGSFSAYAARYIGPRAGFMIGWNWWFICIVVGMLELTAAGVFLDFWFPGIPHWVTAFVALVFFTVVNLVDVKAFGEFEFWFTLVKVLAVVAMIVFGIALIIGVGTGRPTGFSNLWEHGGFAPNGIGGILLGLVAVMFSFGGIESIGTAAGETADPKHAIPRAINGVIVRILLFYILAIGVMLVIWPWNEIDEGGSPFVQILVGLGIGGAATVLNIVVLVAALSVLNTMTYSGARMLFGLAEQGQAPALFKRIGKNGVPVAALLVNAGFMAIAVVLNYLFPGQLLMVLIAIIVGASLLNWGSITISHLRFRALQRAAGIAPVFKAPWWPVANYCCLAFFALIYVTMFFSPDSRAAAITLPIWFVVLLVSSTIVSKVRSRS